jgi:hypothetical protein
MTSKVKTQEWTLRAKDANHGVARIEIDPGDSEIPAAERRMVIEVPKSAWAASDAREFAALVTMVAAKLEAG